MSDVNYLFSHISDLHFSQGTDKSNPDHSHSVKHLQNLEKRVQSHGDIDMLIVSGDISNHGDKQSLINASAFLFDTIPIGEGEYTGLKLPSNKVGVVPGNHDAWNSQKTGKLVDRRQKSLEHYNFAFKEHAIPGDYGCYYRWLQKDSCGIYIAYVDSCFLGDSEEDSDSTFGTMRYDQAIAKGKLTVKQTEKLLEWHDCGMKGNLLENTEEGDSCIDKDMFARSLKIIVMHHYIFEPPQHKSDYFLRMSHRDIIFRNLALSDFDILLCGHKHIPAFDIHTYGHHFDGRATNRYLLNYFRRLIGLHSLPVQFEDGKGRRLSKVVTFLASTLLKIVRRKNPNADITSMSNEVIRMLKEGLDDPGLLKNNVQSYLSEQGVTGAVFFDRDELNQIQKRIAVGLSINERKQLKSIASKIVGMSRKLQARPFLQAMSGSSAKSSSSSNRPRTYNVYKISYSSQKWKVESERYNWNWEADEYDPCPLEQVHVFDKRIE